MEGGTGTHDVGNGINGADFMKMDFLQALMMDLRFDFADPAEDGDGMLFDPGIERSFFNQLAYGRVGSSMVVVIMAGMGMAMAVIVGMRV
jgi:hypothetical protein